MRIKLSAAALSLLILASGLAVAADKKPAAAAPANEKNGPTLAATLKFIQDKLNEQGTVGFVTTRNNAPGTTYRTWYRISDVTTDVGDCSMSTTETYDYLIEVIEGYTYHENGAAVVGDDLRRKSVQTATIPFKSIEKIIVEDFEAGINRNWAQQAHPEISTTITPPITSLTLSFSKPVQGHTVFTKGKQAPETHDLPWPKDQLDFRDEETANRIAKAINHAVELCGGGSNDPF